MVRFKPLELRGNSNSDPFCGAQEAPKRRVNTTDVKLCPSRRAALGIFSHARTRARVQKDPPNGG
jgi:hypothetical protein